MDLIISFFDSWLWEGRNEWMWSTTLPSRWHAAQTLYKMEQRKRAAHAKWKHRMHGHWVTVLGVPPGKHETMKMWNLSPFLLPPYNHRTLISFRGAIKYLKATLNQMLDVGSTETTTFTHNTRKPHLFVCHHNPEFSSLSQQTNSLCMTLHIQSVLCFPLFIPSQLQWLSQQEFLPYTLKGADSFHKSQHTLRALLRKEAMHGSTWTRSHFCFCAVIIYVLATEKFELYFGSRN